MEPMQAQLSFVDEVIGFVSHDIGAAMKGEANYLAALGLMSYTEFFGGLIIGDFSSDRGATQRRINAMWERMGAEYTELIHRDADLVAHLRNGLAHEYFIKRRSVVKMTASDELGSRCGVEFSAGKVYFVVERYFADFSAALGRYRNDLTKSADLLTHLKDAVEGHWALSASELDWQFTPPGLRRNDATIG